MGCFDCFCGILEKAKALLPGAEAGDGTQKEELKKAKGLLQQIIKQKSCGPILVRTAWHDAGTWDRNNSSKGFPNAGGATGSIRDPHEIDAPPNAGLKKALTAYLQAIKDQVPSVSWADLIQLAGATAVEEMGGPQIPMKYGRVDGIPTDKVPAPFGLPAALPPFGHPGVKDPTNAAEHLRYVFNKYNMDDKDIVALSGAHTVGRAFADRSGTVKEKQGDDGTLYTKRGAPQLKNSLTTGGRSWTENWLVFDNTYFSKMKRDGNDPDVIYFPTDLVLMDDPGFKPHFDEFARNQAAFFTAYADAHRRLSELGSKFEPEKGITGV